MKDSHIGSDTFTINLLNNNLQRSSMNTSAGENISEDAEDVEVFVLPILPMQWPIRRKCKCIIDNI